jgi:hypothetical protein
MLTPLVRLTLYCGLGHSEFVAAVRRVFVAVASDDYGVRGRPANTAKISAKTGISRKSVQRVRAERRIADWSPDDEVSPINSIIHYWRYDSTFGSSEGLPRDLPYEGEGGFVELVKKYAGDIPASTIRQEFLRDGLAVFTDEGLLKLVRDFSFPEALDESFLKVAAFTISNHAETVFHNALLADSGKRQQESDQDGRRFERIAWSRKLTENDSRAFEVWVRQRSDELIHDADKYIAHHECTTDEGSKIAPVVGVGIYFIRERLEQSDLPNWRLV